MAGLDAKTATVAGVAQNRRRFLCCTCDLRYSSGCCLPHGSCEAFLGGFLNPNVGFRGIGVFACHQLPPIGHRIAVGIGFPPDRPRQREAGATTLAFGVLRLIRSWTGNTFSMPTAIAFSVFPRLRRHRPYYRDSQKWKPVCLQRRYHPVLGPELSWRADCPANRLEVALLRSQSWQCPKARCPVCGMVKTYCPLA